MGISKEKTSIFKRNFPMISAPGPSQSKGSLTRLTSTPQQSIGSQARRLKCVSVELLLKTPRFNYYFKEWPTPQRESMTRLHATRIHEHSQDQQAFSE